MDRQQNFESVFTNRVNHKNLDSLKKCFLAQPVQIALTRSYVPYSRLSRDSRPIISSTSNSKNKCSVFPAGFQSQVQGSVIKVDQELERDISNESFVIKSKKAPTNQLHSFLLGMTGKINQTIQAQKKLQKDQINTNGKFMTKTSPNKTNNIGIVLDTLKKVKRNEKYHHESTTNQAKNSLQAIQNEIKQNLMCSTIQSPSKVFPKIQDIQTQLPKLQKRATYDVRTENNSVNCVNKCMNTYTPALSVQQKKNSSDEMYSSQKQRKLISFRKPIKIGQQSTNSKKSFTPQLYDKKSDKFIKLSYENTPTTFVKGYLHYHQTAKQMIENYIKKTDTRQSNLTTQNSTRLQKIKKRSVTFSIKDVSAASYIIMNRNTFKVILEKNSDMEIQIASITKVMTFYLCLMVCAKYNVDPKKFNVRISDKAAEMVGTSAQLQAGDTLTLYQLFYGLMLPSGNDASVAIAESAGKIIQRYKKKPSKKSYYDTFIGHMNLFTNQLGLQQSFKNPSGLSLNPNISSARAASIVSALALKNQTFYQVVNCKEYELQIRNERFGLIRKQTWKNTNKLLWKGWQGVKTGTTQTAGHCLMACKGDLIISVYDCSTLNKRFTQCNFLYNWYNATKKQQKDNFQHFPEP